MIPAIGFSSRRILSLVRHLRFIDSTGADLAFFKFAVIILLVLAAKRSFCALAALDEDLIHVCS